MLPIFLGVFGQHAIMTTDLIYISFVVLDLIKLICIYKIRIHEIIGLQFSY
jgi:hypothetical protein